MAKPFTNSGDPDQTLHSAASDLGLYCLPITFYRSPNYNGLTTVMYPTKMYKLCRKMNINAHFPI